MRYLSLFSGIEAATVAWHSLGWEPVAFAQFDPEHNYARSVDFPSAVLSNHYPNVPNLGDVTKITEQQIASLGHIDVIVFCSPCQDLSISGKRAGLEGERSGLFFTALNIINWARKHCGLRFALWENVYGAFSSNQGRDFASVVEQMAGIEDVDVPRYGWGNEGIALGDAGLLEWSTLDAQWFGVAQRRRRVFALADFGDWISRGPILVEQDSLRGDSAPSRGYRKEAAEDIGRGANGADFAHTVAIRGRNGGSVAEIGGEVATALRASQGGGDKGYVLTMAFNHQSGGDHGNVPPTLESTNPKQLVTYAIQERATAPTLNCGPGGKGWQEDIAYTLEARNKPQGVVYRKVVRKLMPIEYERLQGFPDGYTMIPWKGKPAEKCPDGLRYKALGNSMATPVMRWIGRRIDMAINNNGWVN